MTEHSNRETESGTTPLQNGRMLKSVWWVMYFCWDEPKS